MSLPTSLSSTSQLRPLDLALADSLHRLDPSIPDALLTAAALASRALQDGHVCLRLDEIDLKPFSQGERDHNRASFPFAGENSPWLARPQTPSEPTPEHCPLVLEHGLLYLRRYREYERQLAVGLTRLGAHRAAPATPDAALFSRLFPDGTNDPQAQAALTALRHPLLLVTGGPGTGKTTTVARILLLLLANAQAAGREIPRLHLAAPTGQAAARMAASVRSAAQRWQAQGVDPGLCAALPHPGQTLHRLLGSLPDAIRPRHHADNPLPTDILVVDEVSMIDLPLMAKLIDALSTGTGLILLGDPEQLPAVGVGDVLGELVRAQSPHIPRVHLSRSYRQSEHLHLAPLIQAVREGDSSATLHLLRSGTLSGVHFHPAPRAPLDTELPFLLETWRQLATAAHPGAALSHLHDLRILTAVREGAYGSSTLNARFHALLAGRGERLRPHFHGLPILITRNSARLGLFNGDLGVCFRDADGTLLAWFPGEDAHTPRALPLSVLPAHEPAFATTVHKAQGAEFATVVLVLPERDTPVLTRELLYTALTRPRRHLHIIAPDCDLLPITLSRHHWRHSGLAWRLGG